MVLVIISICICQTTTFGNKIPQTICVNWEEGGGGGVVSAFYSSENSEIFKVGSNGTEVSWEKFQKIQQFP